jgi:hypothetical protein
VDKSKGGCDRVGVFVKMVMLRDEFELSAGEAMLNITQMCGLEKFF